MKKNSVYKNSKIMWNWITRFSSQLVDKKLVKLNFTRFFLVRRQKTREIHIPLENLNMVLSSSEGESSGLCPLLEAGGLTLLTLETERPEKKFENKNPLKIIGKNLRD